MPEPRTTSHISTNKNSVCLLLFLFFPSFNQSSRILKKQSKSLFFLVYSAPRAALSRHAFLLLYSSTRIKASLHSSDPNSTKKTKKKH